ncbi:C2H2 type zinc finger domain protein [Polychaeton citri CBS 116435]|uniref:C2H2 type zinc finger domain protein n=1 Tax=Polychaeton citri CBS 116435 TaxID=1314669 RepID=A0A9P4UN74_9PEZI|nr:C2H2 type zinc finger domain protein [Polychaeton citri CBS 116435]
MECSFCRKSFTKGEHLRRSDTGHRPFVCKQCKRAFSRQDSLMRHEKLHRKEAATSTSNLPSPSVDEVDVASSSYGRAGSVPPIMNGGTDTISDFPRLDNVSPAQISGTSWQALQMETPLSDLDLNLIWPDSQDLFQSIISADKNGTWQLPLGTLPFPSDTQYAEVPSVNMGPTSAPSHATSDRPSRHGDNHQAVRGVSNMVTNISSSINAALESASITSVFLDECLHMFFDRFIPTFPVMHRWTFIFRDCTHPLLLNAIAIGSLYLGPKDSITKGELLWRLAHTAVATSWQSLITHQGPHDVCPGVQLVLTGLLSVTYGALSKNSAVRTAAQAFHASAFFWARQCGMFYSPGYDITRLPSLSAPKAEKEYQWKLWVAREIQQRALIALYILDGLISHMSGNSTSVRHTSNNLQLPSSEVVFREPHVDGWLARMHQAELGQGTFRQIYQQMFSPSEDFWIMINDWSVLSLRVILEGLQSMIADSDPDDGAILNAPTSSDFSRALSQLYDNIAHRAALSDVERLEVLLRWHAVCLEAVTKSPQLCKFICTRWDIQQEVWPNSNVRARQYNLQQFANSRDGRRAILHAAAIQDIVERLPRGRAHVTHMPSSLFAAATVYSAFTLAGHSTVKHPINIEWTQTLAELDIRPPGEFSETVRFILGNVTALERSCCTTRTLSYEMNSMQKLFGCFTTQWGVATDMEKVVSQWIALCH